MRTLVAFRISEFQEISILINDDNKINIYGYKSNGLHVFDEVKVHYIKNGKAADLISDNVQYIVDSFSNSLEMAHNNELSLDQSLIVGKVGYFFSEKKYIDTREYNESEKKKDIFSQYWIWSSSNNIQTWIYNVNHKIYLEISMTYPWLFSDPQEDELYISFDEYKNNYKPILIIELQKFLVKKWLQQCQDLLQKMEQPEKEALL